MSTYVPDPRSAATATTDGEGLQIVDRVTIDGRTIDFPRPLPGAPEYAAVVTSERLAEELRPLLFQDLDKRYDPPWQPNTPLVLNMQSHAGTVVTAAMTGMEAFANHFISRSAPDGVLAYSAGEIPVVEVFNLPIHERYRDVLPELTEKPKPTNEPWWPTFRRIQRLAVLQRHALYDHQPVGKGLDVEGSLAQHVYSGAYCGAASMMMSAFEHFSPGWFSDERRQALEKTVI